MRLNFLMRFFVALCFVFLFILALYPERPARLLTPQDGWVSSASIDAKTSLAAFSDRVRFVRRSAVESSDGLIFRTWSPSKGTRPLELESLPFKPAKYMSVIVAGQNRTIQGGIQAHLVCKDTGQAKEIYSGGVGVNVVEAIVVTPPSWCNGNVALKFSSTEANTLAGVGSVYEISWLSWFKSSFLGKLPYALVSFLIFALLMLSGASVTMRLGGTRWNPVPVAFVSLGLGALAVFYLTSMMPSNLRWAGAVTFLAAAIGGVLYAGKSARKSASVSLLPYFKVWGLAGLIYLAMQGLVVHSLGHWEPNYRFWPAVWDSDNELPWLYAEAIRNGWSLKELFGGAWLPTDRPPLMAGAYLLLTDIFRLLQTGNDGLYLKGQAYNFAAVVLNTLWVPAIWWGLRKLLPEMGRRVHLIVLIFIASLPMVLFNTTYGWPKYFGAAYALMAGFIVFGMRDNAQSQSDRATPLFFFLLAALSMLSHASTAFFLIPLGLLFLFWVSRYQPRDIALGMVAGAVLLASWSLYKYQVLPSTDVLTKYALTGDMGFFNRDQPLLELLKRRYGDMSMPQWLEIKGEMLLQSFMPFHQQLNNLDLYFDAGTSVVDKWRAWDMFMLTKGNIGILLLSAVALYATLRATGNQYRDEFNRMRPFLYLLALGFCSWILIVLCFFVAIIIHHWPQAALFALALGAATITGWFYPRILAWVATGTICYTFTVWGVHPMASAIAIDWGAVITLLMMGGILFMSYIRTSETELQALIREETQISEDDSAKEAPSAEDTANAARSTDRTGVFGALKAAVWNRLRIPGRQYVSARLDGIEALRAYAALSIILFHMAAIGHVNVPETIAFIKSHFGFGVPLFFVVSGYCMTYGYFGKLNSLDTYRGYFIRRFTRIAPLFYFMLGFQLLHLWAVYDVTMRPWEIVVNAAFIFNLIPHLTDGIVPASWSIGVEMLFYAIFPVAILFATNLRRSLGLLLCAIVLATQFTVDMKPQEEAMGSFIHHNFLTNFPYFAWGILGYHLFRFANGRVDEHSRRVSSWIICGVAILLMVMLYRGSDLYMFFWNRGLRTTWDALWGIPFAALCIGLAIYPTRMLSNLFTRFMGKISFSLYLVHPTVVYYLWKIGAYNYINNTFTEMVWAGFGISVVLTVAITVLIAYFTYQYIELPGMALGQRLAKENSEVVISLLSPLMERNIPSGQHYEQLSPGVLNSSSPVSAPTAVTVSQLSLQSAPVLLATALLIYVLTGMVIGSPIFGSDEYAYFIQGKFLGQQGSLIQLDPYLQKIASPLFLYIVHWIAKLGAMDITSVVRILHAAEYCLTAYVLTKLFQGICGPKYLLAGLVAVLLLPGAYYMLAVMPEMELLLISSLVAYVLIVQFPQQHYTAAALAGVLLGLALLIKPHALAIIAAALMMILIAGFFGLPKERRTAVPIKASLLMLGTTYLTFVFVWRICEKSWTFDPTVALGLNFYGKQLASPASAIDNLLKIVDVLRYLLAHMVVLLLVFAPAFMLMFDHLVKIFARARVRCGEAISISNRSEMAVLFVVLMLLSHALMTSYFTVGAGLLNSFEALRLHGRYLGSVVIFLPFLYFAWLGKQGDCIGQRVILIFVAAAAASYLWVFRTFKIFPWDHPLLYSFFSYPNHYGWGFEGQLPFVGKWLFWLLLTAYLLVLFRKDWIRPFVFAQLFGVLLVGLYQMTNWMLFHTTANAGLSENARAISKLMGPEIGRGVYVSNERYGSMSYALYGLAAAPKVLVKQPGETLIDSDVQGYDWVLLGSNYVPHFYYSSEIEIDKFKLYLINSKLVAREHKRELLPSGQEMTLFLGKGKNGSLKLTGFNAQEEWGAVTSASEAELKLPFLVKGDVRIKIFGWIPKGLPTRKMKISAGEALTDVELSEAPGEHEIRLKVAQTSDSIMVAIPTVAVVEEGRKIGAAIGYVKIEIMSSKLDL